MNNLIEGRSLEGRVREAFNKKKTKKLKFFNLGLTPPTLVKVKNIFFHFFLKIDHI